MVVGAFVSSLLDATAWILVRGRAIAVVAVVSGPYLWARTLRARAASGPGTWPGWSGRGHGRGRRRRRSGWAHREIVQGGAIVAGILSCCWPTCRGLPALLALVAAVVVGVQRIADVTETGEAAEPEGGAAGARAGPCGPAPLSRAPSVPLRLTARAGASAECRWPADAWSARTGTRPAAR